jgi:hypothetical protein
MQEYYESQNANLFNRKFDTFKFLHEMMDDNGKISYFREWTGFNIPGNVINDWKVTTEELTPYEFLMFNQLKEAKLDTKKPYYIIGALESHKRTIKHEIAHALYSTNSDYFDEMSKLTGDLYLYKEKHFNKIRDNLIKMGYNRTVVLDEIQAYLSSEKTEYLKKEIYKDIEEIKPILKKYRKVLSKYNNFDY